MFDRQVASVFGSLKIPVILTRSTFVTSEQRRTPFVSVVSRSNRLVTFSSLIFKVFKIPISFSHLTIDRSRSVSSSGKYGSIGVAYPRELEEKLFMIV